MILNAYFSALICALTRGALNVFDRAYFKKENTNFTGGLLFNAGYPFLIALCFGLFQNISITKLIKVITVPGVFFAAIGAQLTASIFSYAFKKMSVRSIVFSSKFADIFIPIFLLPVTLHFDIYFYLFSCATSILFVPFVLAIRKSKEAYNFRIIFLIIITLSIQALINASYSLTELSLSWKDFLTVFIAISFYRLVITSILHVYKTKASVDRKSKEFSEYYLLFFRAIIACASQGAFFYSLTRLNGNDIWPILNISPFAASIFAARFLKEKFGRLVVITSLGIVSLLSAYLFLTS